MAAASYTPNVFPSVNLAQAIVRDIAPYLLAAMQEDLAREFARKIRHETLSADDYEIIEAVCSVPVWKAFRRKMRELETVREGEAFADGANAKRVSRPTKHKNADYFEAVEEHSIQCHPSGGFVAGSGLHWRPVEDKEYIGDCPIDKGVKRKRLVRHEED